MPDQPPHENTGSPEETGAERRLHQRTLGHGSAAHGTPPTIDFGFGPVDVLDWSNGGARLKGTSLTLSVGEFATGTITMNAASGPFIADVVRVDPPYFDPHRPPEEISLRWLDLPADVLAHMVAAKA